jgi:NAD(P)-dependent dehydrogenase (short-subunit alcohol dehydrogenase family)
MKLEGKVALITGAGSGIGKAIALLFAHEGADIAVNDIDLASAEATAAEVKTLGRRAAAVMADVSNEPDVRDMVSAVLKDLGAINILVNNAGISGAGPTVDTDMADWDREVDVLLRGPFLCSREAGRWMIGHGGGKIVNIASVVGMIGFAESLPYGAAKAGLINLTRGLATEWGRFSISVNCIAPGFVRTPLKVKGKGMSQAEAARLMARVPFGRAGEPEEIARAALFLASDDASYITGVTLPVDGGFIAYGHAPDNQ